MRLGLAGQGLCPRGGHEDVDHLHIDPSCLQAGEMGDPRRHHLTQLLGQSWGLGAEDDRHGEAHAQPVMAERGLAAASPRPLSKLRMIGFFCSDHRKPAAADYGAADLAGPVPQGTGQGQLRDPDRPQHGGLTKMRA